MNDIFIRMIDMPGSFPGMTIEDADGDYNVYINAQLSQARRIKAYRHEMDHIRHNDFEKATAAIAEMCREGRINR